ncbi:MAG: cytidylyltransferase domain-containing protein [Acidimicrobiia bacterium]
MSVNVVTVVQARVGSTRLPGKALRQVGGKPLLWWQLQRMMRSKLSGSIVVAVPEGKAQSPIAALCRDLGIPVVSGPEDDLLERHLMAARIHRADVVVKVPSDCPLIDPAVMDAVIAVHLDHPNATDYVSNLHPMSWPDGQDVEVIPTDVLEEAGAEARHAFEREHTTPFIWERPERYRLANVTWDRDRSNDVRLTVDYPEDLAVVEAVLSDLPLHAGVDRIVAYLDERPEIAGLNTGFRGVNWYRHHLPELFTVGVGDTRWAPGERDAAC